MGVTIQRQTNQLKRTEPTADAVVCLIMSGAAVAGKIALGEHKVLFGRDGLTTLGITEANNPLAFKDISDFYTVIGEGAELNIMLVVDTTSITDVCDTANQLAKKLLDSTEGRGVILAVNRKTPAGYVPVIAAGLDADINSAMTKLNALGAEYQAQNIPFIGLLPALGWTKETSANMPARSTLNNDYVALNAWCNAADKIVSMGQFAAWVGKHQVHQNIGRVASGKLSDTAYMPDGTAPKDLKNQWNAIALKGLCFPVKINGKSGFFYKDDPCMTSLSSDYSSISWNRTINKAQRIADAVLVEKLNDDVDVDPGTGDIESSLLSDWESDVETAIRQQMQTTSGLKKKEISGVKCFIDPESNIINDQVDATITIVRKGQAKEIGVKIGYGVTI